MCSVITPVVLDCYVNFSFRVKGLFLVLDFVKCDFTGWCGSAPTQVQLYEDFAKSRAKASVDESISSASTGEEEEEEKPKLKATGHVFQVGPLAVPVLPI